jgi:hypothetical protein
MNVKPKRFYIPLIMVICCLINSPLFAQKLDDFQPAKSSSLMQNTIQDELQAKSDSNGHRFNKWIHYGNLFKMNVPDISASIAHSKADIAEDMGVPGLSMQEGFMNGLITGSFTSLDQPSLNEIEQSLPQGNLLILLDPDSDAGKKLNQTIKGSHLSGSKDFVKVNAFVLQKDKSKIFVISSKNSDYRNRVKTLIDNAIQVVKDYDLHRGWFGAATLFKAVTCTPGHPLDVIGKGMNEGNDWFVFSGYMEFLAKKELEDWMTRANLPIVTDVGYSPIYGCQNYDSLQVQSTWGDEAWIKFAHEHGGYVFRQGSRSSGGNSVGNYDGNSGGERNKKQIDKEDKPFITTTGDLESGCVPSMILFAKKGKKFTREVMWQSILSRKEVGVLRQGKMMGPALYRNALNMLSLDREFLEEYYGDRVNIDAVTDGYQLKATFTNTYNHPVSGKLNIGLPAEIKIKGEASSKLDIPANSSKTVTFHLQPLAEAMAKANPIAVLYNWGSSKKSTIAMLDLPPAISVNRLLYGHTPSINYPVTIHNFTGQTSFPVKVEVLEKGKSANPVFTTTKTCTTPTSTFKDMQFDLKIPSAGSYDVKVTALGVTNISQLGVGEASGKPKLYAIDLNNDGVNEYRMENDSVQVTLLSTGARIVEYIVKSKNDNVFFKLWPKKPNGDRRPFRDRGFYAYGGFEDFLGQASIETHKVYNAEITHKDGDYVQVKMSADYFGNTIEKTFTLYGNSPLVEIRFALKFKNPELNVFGPQPILELGKRHWTEDVFTVPSKDGLRSYRMLPEKYYGRIFFQKEGWNSGYDTEENISFVGAYPVTQPYFLHMWMNHPSNNDAQYYYSEFQLWIPIIQKSTFYFTYYMWAAAGPYENGLKELRDRNLITEQNFK